MTKGLSIIACAEDEKADSVIAGREDNHVAVKIVIAGPMISVREGSSRPIELGTSRGR
jgi:hypothetical protein